MSGGTGNSFARRHGHTGQRGGRGGPIVKSPTYQSWSTMNDRCLNDGHRHWEDYGGRGIEVCERWRRGRPGAFDRFLADMGLRPEGHTLDRVDVNGNYEKDNCRWSTKSTQRRNQRSKRPAEPSPESTERAPNSPQ